MWIVRIREYFANATRCGFLSIYASSQEGMSSKQIIFCGRSRICRASSLYPYHVGTRTPWPYPAMATFTPGERPLTASLA